MNAVILSAVIGLLGTAANAQPQTPAQPPAQQQVAPAQQQVAPAQPPMTKADLMKKHAAAKTELKAAQAAELKGITDPKAKLELKKKHHAAMKDLEAAQKAEMDQYKKDHPEAVKHHKKAAPKVEKKAEAPAPAKTTP